MAAKFTRLTHKIATQLHLVAEISTICSSCFGRPVRKLLDAPSYTEVGNAKYSECYLKSVAVKTLKRFKNESQVNFIAIAVFCIDKEACAMHEGSSFF